MASFAKLYADYTVGKTSCCGVYPLPSNDKSCFQCRVCNQEVIVVPVGKTIEEALLSHAKENTEKAKRTTVSPLRHNAIQIMQDFGETTYVIAEDQWNLWRLGINKTSGQRKEQDKLVLYIINVYIMTKKGGFNIDDIRVADIGEAMYNDKDYLRRMFTEKAVPIADRLGITVAALANEMIEICVHKKLKEVLYEFSSAEVS